MNAFLLLAFLLPCQILAEVGNLTTIQVAYPTRNLTYSEEWDYFAVRPNANLFYWLYWEVEQTPNNDRPLFLWLQGGPGASGTGFGNFQEIGPLDVNLNPRSTTWLSRGDLLFVDSPVGTGYSYVTSPSDYTTNVDEIAADLIALMTDFMSKHPQYQDRPFYITCESYGGKMAAVFAWHLYTATRNGQLAINFKGVGLGDSWISPIDFVDTWPDYLYYLSRLSPEGLDKAKSQADKCDKDVEQGKWTDATNCWDTMETVIGMLSGGVSWYNVLKQADQDPWSLTSSSAAPKEARRLFNPFDDQLSKLMNGPIRDKLGIIPQTVTWGGQSSEVFDKQSEDFMKPVIDTVDSLLNFTHLTVFIYNGQLDLICDTAGVERWVNKLQWPGLQAFQEAARNPVYDTYGNKDLQAFSRQYQNLQFYWILKAGHMVPADAPLASLTLLDIVTSGKS